MSATSGSDWPEGGSPTALNERFETLLAQQDYPSAVSLLEGIHPADAADLLDLCEPEALVEIVVLWGAPGASSALAELESDAVSVLARELPPELFADLLDAMAPDDAAHLLESIDPELRAPALGRMERDEASDVAELLEFEEGTAGRSMSQDFFAIGGEQTAEEVIQALRQVPEDVEMVYYVYVLGGSSQLRGVVSLRQLITADPSTAAESLMYEDLVTASPHDPMEAVADLFSRYNLLAIPVTDELGRLLGIVTIDDALEHLEEEAEEDVLRFAGSFEDEGPGVTRAWGAVRRRLPWLAAATILELLIAFLILRPLPAELMVATIVYIPLLVFVGGNTAVQAAARVLVRLESERTETWGPWLLARKELEAGVVISLFAVAAGFPLMMLLSRDLGLAVTVSAALGITVVLAAIVGAALPILLRGLHLDPAIASGPLLGSAMDIISLTVYLTLALYLTGLT